MLRGPRRRSGCCVSPGRHVFVTSPCIVINPSRRIEQEKDQLEILAIPSQGKRPSMKRNTVEPIEPSCSSRSWTSVKWCNSKERESSKYSILVLVDTPEQIPLPFHVTNRSTLCSITIISKTAIDYYVSAIIPLNKATITRIMLK
jgi:hypothetical protein